MWAGGDGTWFSHSPCIHRQPVTSSCTFRLESWAAPAPAGLPHTPGSRGSVLCHPGMRPVRLRLAGRSV